MRRNAGFGLVEVLVALLLVAFAMLGVARLQIGAMESGRRSLDALALHGHVHGVADRVRALHDATPDVRALLAGEGANHDCRGVRRCTPQEFAEYEAWGWTEDGLALRDATASPIEVRLDAAPAHFAFRVARRGGAPYVVEIAS